MNDTSLEVTANGQVLFSSNGKWLHPLFDLEAFLAEKGMDASGCEIRDKVVGRGSAFLMVRLGARRVHAGMLSRLGKDVLERAGVAHTWDVLVEEIQCRTESLLRNVTEPDEAYRILAERAKRTA